MLNIRIKRKHNGVPILSRKEIDAIGEELAGDFCPAALTTPQPLDVDGFAEQYLHMTQDYQFLERILSRNILSVRILPVFHLQLYRNKPARLQAYQSCNVTAQ